MRATSSDVVIAGSGAAALTAAIAAADQGSTVSLVEKSDKIGGSTSFSNGEIWVPNNHYMKQMNILDDKESALRYLQNFDTGLMDSSLLLTYVESAPRVLEYLEEKTPLKVEQRYFPDYHAEFDGGRFGRSLGVSLFDLNSLGEWSSKVRLGKYPAATTREVAEWTSGTATSDVSKIKFDVIEERRKHGLVGRGSALVGMLLKGCLDRNVTILTKTPVKYVLKDSKGEIVGLEALAEGSGIKLLARKGVIIATGGFDWNEELCKKFLMFPWARPMSPTCIEGDGLILGLNIGADMEKMTHALWAPCIAIPSDESSGRPVYRLLIYERALPGSIVVNKKGIRFVNEAVNYHDFVRAMHTFDSASASFENVESWLILDQTFRNKYMVVGIRPSEPTPPWITTSQSLEGLAKKLGIDQEGLGKTVRRFNEYAVSGTDQDFHRGECSYDLQYADKSNRPNPSLGKIVTPPFYAIRVFPGLIGTAGGMRINEKAQVLDQRHRVIPRLYACGNVASFLFAPAYPASGSGIGNAIVLGFIAGFSAASEGRKFGKSQCHPMS